MYIIIQHYFDDVTKKINQKLRLPLVKLLELRPHEKYSPNHYLFNCLLYSSNNIKNVENEMDMISSNRYIDYLIFLSN